MLGAEQSGFISEIGFETYQKILNEAIEELKETDFKDLFPSNPDDKIFVSDVQIDTDIQILIPDDYVNNVEERLILYTDLTNIENEQELEIFEENLVDRFGEYPVEVANLLESMKLKWMAKTLGFERIVLKNSKMLAYFTAKPQSAYFQTKHFQHILNVLQENPRLAQFKQKEAKTKDGNETLLLRFEEVKTVQKAIENLKKLMIQQSERVSG